MALVEIEGFDHQANATDLIANVATTGGPWAWSILTLAGTLLVPGQGGGNALSLGTSGIFGGSLLAPFAGATAIVGCAARIPVGGSLLIGFWDSATEDPMLGQMQLSVLVDAATRAISIYRGSPSGVLLHSAGAPFTVGGWFYFEVKATIAAAAGAITLHLNGNPYLSLAALDTQAGAAARLDGLFFGGGGSALVDHIYIADTTVGPGGNPFNDFQATPTNVLRVFTRFPSGPGAAAQFTPLSGANYTQVRELAMDGDASYNYDSGAPLGDKDLFAAGAVPVGAMPLACKVEGAYRKAGAPGVLYQIVNKLLSGATEVDGAPVTLLPQYTYQADIYPLNPNGAAAWGEASVNASQIGYEVTSGAAIGPPPPPPPPPPAPLSIDGAVAVATFVGPANPTRTITITTHFANEVILLQVCMQATAPPAPVVLSVTSAGLDWGKRSGLSGNTGDGNPGEAAYYGDHEVWWAIAAAPLVAEVITVTVGSALGWIVLEAWGVVGADTIIPWDLDPSLPKYAANLNAIASTTEVIGVSTANANDMALFFYMDVFGAFTISATGPLTFTRVVSDGEIQAFIGLGIDASIFESITSSPLSSATFVGHRNYPAGDGPLSGWIMIADALRAA